jgi:hypothetical protein
VVAHDERNFFHRRSMMLRIIIARMFSIYFVFCRVVVVVAAICAVGIVLLESHELRSSNATVEVVDDDLVEGCPPPAIVGRRRPSFVFAVTVIAAIGPFFPSLFLAPRIVRSSVSAWIVVVAAVAVAVVVAVGEDIVAQAPAGTSLEGGGGALPPLAIAMRTIFPPANIGVVVFVAVVMAPAAAAVVGIMPVVVVVVLVVVVVPGAVIGGTTMFLPRPSARDVVVIANVDDVVVAVVVVVVVMVFGRERFRRQRPSSSTSSALVVDDNVAATC